MNYKIEVVTPTGIQVHGCQTDQGALEVFIREVRRPLDDNDYREVSCWQVHSIMRISERIQLLRYHIAFGATPIEAHCQKVAEG